VLNSCALLIPSETVSSKDYFPPSDSINDSPRNVDDEVVPDMALCICKLNHQWFYSECVICKYKCRPS